MEKRYIKKKEQFIYFVILLVTGLFFYLFLGENGPIVLSDSEKYLYNSDILPRYYYLYSIFLRIVFFLVGPSLYLDFVVILQGLIAFLSSVYVTEWLRSRFQFSYTIAFLLYICSMLPYGYCLPECVLTHQILTEALAVPLFNICMIFMMKIMLDRKKKDFAFLFFINILLVFIRPQLAVLLVATVLLVLYYVLRIFYVRIKEERKKFFVGILFLGSVILISGSVFYIKRDIGSYAQLTDAVAGRVLCTVNNEDLNLFDGEEKAVFEALYSWIDKEENRSIYFEKNLFVADDIMYSTNENSKNYIDIMLDYYRNIEPNSSFEEIAAKVWIMRSRIIGKLFDAHFGDYIFMTICLLPQSLVASIFVQPDSIRSICYCCAFFLYAISAILLMKAKKMDVFQKYFIPIIAMYVSLLVNVLLTNIVFYGVQRYVIYTFGWFYMSLVILLVGIRRAYMLQNVS